MIYKEWQKLPKEIRDFPYFERKCIIGKWHYEEDDDDMHEVGQEMSRISKLPFEYVEIKL